MWRVSRPQCPGYRAFFLLVNLCSNTAISFEWHRCWLTNSFQALPLFLCISDPFLFFGLCTAPAISRKNKPPYVFDVQMILTMLLIMELHAKSSRPTPWPFRHGRYKSQEAKGGVRITDDVDRDFYRYHGEKEWGMKWTHYYISLPETNSSPLKIGLPNRKGSYSNHPFLGANR